MPYRFLGSGPITHTDLGDYGPSDPYGYEVGAAATELERQGSEEFTLLWSYVVPEGKKTRIRGFSLHGSQRAIAGRTNFTSVRDGNPIRVGIVEVLVGGSPVLELDSRGHGYWAAVSGGNIHCQYALARDADLQSKIELHDGVLLTAGQVLTVEMDVIDPTHTVPGIYMQVTQMRFWGKNTATGDFVMLKAILRPHTFGNDQLFFWNDDETALSYTVPAGGITLMGAWIRTEVGDTTISMHNILYLNGEMLAVFGPLVCGTGRTVEPLYLPFGDAEIYPSDRLELRGSLGPDFGQTISVHMIGEEVPLSTYPRSRVSTP